MLCPQSRLLSLFVVYAQGIYLPDLPASQEPNWRKMRSVYKLGMEGQMSLLDVKAARYMTPVKIWTLMYPFTPGFLRTRAMTSALFILSAEPPTRGDCHLQGSRKHQTQPIYRQSRRKH